MIWRKNHVTGKRCIGVVLIGVVVLVIIRHHKDLDDVIHRLVNNFTNFFSSKNNDDDVGKPIFFLNDDVISRVFFDFS